MFSRQRLTVNNKDTDIITDIDKIFFFSVGRYVRIYSYSLRLRSKRGFASSKSNLFRKFDRGYILSFPSERKACCEKLSYKFSPRVNLHMERYKEDFGTDTWKVGQNRARGYAHCHPPSGWRAAMFHAGRRGFATRTISVAPRAIDAAEISLRANIQAETSFETGEDRFDLDESAAVCPAIDRPSIRPFVYARSCVIRPFISTTERKGICHEQDDEEEGNSRIRVDSSPF